MALVFASRTAIRLLEFATQILYSVRHSMPSTFAIRSERVVTPSGINPATVLVKDGTISSVMEYNVSPLRVPMEDVGASVVMPGLVDSHVHINEPGRTAWEGQREPQPQAESPRSSICR